MPRCDLSIESKKEQELHTKCDHDRFRMQELANPGSVGYGRTSSNVSFPGRQGGVSLFILARKGDHFNSRHIRKNGPKVQETLHAVRLMCTAKGAPEAAFSPPDLGD